jgi:hypothetical protein
MVRRAAPLKSPISRFVLAWSLAACALAARAQQPPVHYFQSANLPPGAVAAGQLTRPNQLAGYVQPVEIQVPDGVRISLNVGGQFDESRPGPVQAGMLIGPVYSLKITNIPFREGQEVFPTIEMINRLYPPPGQERCFPVPVQLTREELEFALDGRFVTRVIYLEDTATALPRRDEPGDQRFFEVPPDQDPLQVADRLGRPMAILRMGSRIPDPNTEIVSCPPLFVYEPLPASANTAKANAAKRAPNSVESAIERPERDTPRVFFPRNHTGSSTSAGGSQLR